MSWFRNPFKKQEVKPRVLYTGYFEDYPRAWDWVSANGPHTIDIRTYRAKDGRYRVQIIDKSPIRIGNRKTLGVTPGRGYDTKEDADIVADVINDMTPGRVDPRVITDRNGKYRWRLVWTGVRECEDEIIQNTAGASFATELEAREALGRVVYADSRRIEG